MSKTNCVNCGHGKDPDAIKCPFCGTTYLDFTSIDLDGRTPCVLTLKMPGSENLFQMKAYPGICNITFEPEVCSMRDVGGRIQRYDARTNITCDISFHGI